MQVSELVQLYKIRLQDIYPPEEITSIVQLVFAHLLKYSKIDIHLNQNTQIDSEMELKFTSFLDRLEKSEPVQHILGETEFYGLKFLVNKHVLIPRQETELLVNTVLELPEASQLKEILDLGTGSGCIAVTLAKHLREAKVTALDISKEAIQVAAQNAIVNGANVTFIEKDMRQLSFDRQFDLIVSNPPYVLESERQQMHNNILNFEPDKALFVDDSHPLEFYEAIGRIGTESLAPNGILLVEINERLGKQTSDLFRKFGFANTKIIRDLNNKDRFIQAQR